MEGYRTKKPLGAGGLGRVLLAEDKSSGRECAIKKISVAGTDSATLDAEVGSAMCFR